MISLKDIPVYLSIAGTVFGGGVYINSLQRDVAELGSDYRQHVAEQQETTLTEKKWKLEDRLKKTPEDEDAKRDLEIVNRLLIKNQMQQQHLRGEK